MATRGTIWDIEDQTAAKHLILRKYLEGWFGVMGHSQPRIVYMDAFAGPGEYSDGTPGSPLLALDVLRQHKALSTGCEFVLLFNEMSKPRHDHLLECLQRDIDSKPLPNNVSIRLENSDFISLSREVRDTLDSAKSRLAPTFAFLDPFGYSGLTMEAVNRLFSWSHIDLLVYLDTNSLNRFGTSPTVFAQFESLFGTQDFAAAPPAGIEYIDGWWFTDGIQPGLLDIPRPPRNATKAVRVASQARFDARRPFAFRANGKTKAGNLRLRGPAVPDAVEKDANGRVTSVRGMRVRCVNAPYYRFASRSLPLTKCVRGTACGCSKTITITNEDHLNSMEPLLWGSTKWANEYHRRNLVEAFNAREEFHQGVGRHSIRVRAESWDFAHALLTAGTLISMFHAWLMRLGAHALDPAVVNVFTEPVIRACLAVVGITLNRWESPPRE